MVDPTHKTRTRFRGSFRLTCLDRIGQPRVPNKCQTDYDDRHTDHGSRHNLSYVLRILKTRPKRLMRLTAKPLDNNIDVMLGLHRALIPGVSV